MIINTLRAALNHLQSYLHGDTEASKSRGSLILVEQVIVILAECVTSFSELEETLGTSNYGAEMRALDRLKWATKESRLAAIIHKLQSNKASLTLMLTILQWFAHRSGYYHLSCYTDADAVLPLKKQRKRMSAYVIWWSKHWWRTGKYQSVLGI